MENTIREDIIAALVTQMAVIRTTSPQVYWTDCGQRVQRAVRRVDPGHLPAIVVWPMVETAQKTPYGSLLCKMPFKIEGVVKFGAVEPSVQAERILGDLQYAVFTAWTDAPANIESITYVRGGVEDYPDGDEMAVCAFIEIEIAYIRDLYTPYS